MNDPLDKDLLEMMEYLNEEQASFFKWCDQVVNSHAPQEGAVLKGWHPRKNKEGGYELTFVLEAKTTDEQIRRSVAVPEEYHELLEQEYFILHPDDHEH